jgi:hypothetical protein
MQQIIVILSSSLHRNNQIIVGREGGEEQKRGRGTESIIADHLFMRDSIIMREREKEMGHAVVKREWGVSKGWGQEQETSHRPSYYVVLALVVL